MNGAAIAAACAFDRKRSASYQTPAHRVSQTVAKKSPTSVAAKPAASTAERHRLWERLIYARLRPPCQRTGAPVRDSQWPGRRNPPRWGTPRRAPVWCGGAWSKNRSECPTPPRGAYGGPHLAFARLWRDQRKVQQARELLAPGGSGRGSTHAI
jgi:hypothetical protein